jgi:DNA-directed RNA polymerase specialized sigma24 family protein
VREKQVESDGPVQGDAAQNGGLRARAESPAARRRNATDAPSSPGRGQAATAGDEFQGSLDRDPRADTGAVAWRQWLAGGSSREVLARIVQEDPLGVREHVARALRDGAYLMDSQRVALRCFALVARHAIRYRGRPDLQEWLQALAREAICAILRDDGEAERKPIVPGHEPGREHGTAFAALARPLGLEPDAMGRACLSFNRLPQADRAAFVALVIAGRPLEELVRAHGESATDIARRARRGLDTILAAAAAPAPDAPAHIPPAPGAPTHKDTRKPR